jgi:hypothetical protein
MLTVVANIVSFLKVLKPADTEFWARESRVLRQLLPDLLGFLSKKFAAYNTSSLLDLLLPEK